MSYLLDTSTLLRVVDSKDARHGIVTAAVRELIARREQLTITTQNVAEFCNVATRPVANNGLGLPPRDALRLLQHEIEPISTVLIETDATYGELKRLIDKYDVSGKQVHDARLVAMMRAWQIENVLTLNDRDFRRYEAEGIRVETPHSLVGG